jgi:hypothetical protein
VTPFWAGVVVRSDGSPLGGAPVALIASAGDTSCRKAVIRGVTAPDGHFVFPATRVRKHILWVPPMENLGLVPYWLCAGAIDSAAGPLYHARTMIPAHVWGDSLACLTWVWEDG